MKRLFTLAALVAVANLAALIGLAGYAHAQGWLTQERVREALAILKGEQEETAASQPADAQENLPKSTVERIQRNREIEERYVIELNRREREIQDAWKLLETRQLDMLREKEALEETKKRFAEEVAQRVQQADDSGLQRELSILSGIGPKDAKDLLRQKQDADVVWLLMTMDVRKARKIVSACKANDERLWIGRVLSKLHEQDATQAEALGAGI